MRRLLVALISAGFLSGVLWSGSAVGSVPSKVGPLPDSTLTPGAKDDKVTQENIAQTICVPGYTKTARKVSSRTKSKVYAEYKVSKTDRSKYTIDHLVPLELGGSNSIQNLWPEPKNGDKGSKSKDQVEGNLHSMVCGGTVPLADAQTAIATDWTTAETKVVPSTTTITVPPTSAVPVPVTTAPAPPPAPNCPNGTYVNSSGNEVCRPFSNPGGPPPGATAICNDGSYSFSQHRQGTCSSHGGVRQFL